MTSVCKSRFTAIGTSSEVCLHECYKEYREGAIELDDKPSATFCISFFYSGSSRSTSYIISFQTVYWYTLSIFYLTENETHKAMALRPQNAESMWKQHFESNFGRIHALRNYTDQLALRCWEIGVEGANSGWEKPLYRKKVRSFIVTVDRLCRYISMKI
ncbi:hypothetical protein COOONC_19854 [Cooperia oncophora]